MGALVIPIDRQAHEAWDDYIAKRDRAQTTGDIKDGIAAGKAWRRWIDLFVPREPVEGLVVEFKRGEQ